MGFYVGFLPRGFSGLKELVKISAVWMYDTFTVIASKLGCTNWDDDEML